MHIKKVAAIFDNSVRPETTGGYCLRALSTLVETQHFLPSQIDEIPHTFDLFLFVDDGLNYPLPEKLRPSAWWAIDTHMDFDRCLAKARSADHVFAAQKNGAERLHATGIEKVQWLPLACDPDIHRRHPVPKRFDVAFVGNLVPGPRLELLDAIRKNVPNHWIGRCYFDEMAKMFSASRVIFNRSVLDDVNMRVFEALASGSLLLTNPLEANGLEEMFQDGVHLATYNDARDLLEKLRFYIEHEDIRERIAAAGHTEVRARHTYLHRMQTILDVAAARSPQTSRHVDALTVPAKDRPGAPGNQASRATKDPLYFQFDRPEVLKLVPPSAARVLDVGCSSGLLGRSIKQRQPAEVIGLELNPAVADLARVHLDNVLNVNIESDNAEFPNDRFDCVICADVLEHLMRPLGVLKKIRSWLTPSGRLVASIPNVGHHTVISGLLDGTWDYQSAGLLDIDHVRFFTLTEIEKLYERAGFKIEQLQFVPGNGFTEWLEQGCPPHIRLGKLHLAGLPRQSIEQFHAYQYILSAVPIQVPDRGCTSIVIVTYNELAYTRKCLQSLFDRTDEPIEVIVVDNGSTDGTVEFLKAIPEIRVICNPNNRGYPAAANQGIRAASGDQIVLLNNDCIVTSGWLRRLLDALYSRPDVGLAGPLTNCTAGRQRNEAAYPLRELDDFAWNLGKRESGKRIDVAELTGFCLVLKRETLDRIGFLDERFGLGTYVDIDYCRRASTEGLRMVVAADAFVHHFGHRSFHGNGIDQDLLAVHNEQVFRDKWRDLDSPTESTLAVDISVQESQFSVAKSRGADARSKEPDEPLLELLPSQLKNCLLVGRRASEIGVALRRLRPDLQIVEALTDPREITSSALDAILAACHEELSKQVGSGWVDCVICEPLCEFREPHMLLMELRRWLSPMGTLLATFPNSRQQQVVTALLRHSWTNATPDGVAEDPLRFFTRADIEKLLYRAGFEIADIRSAPAPHADRSVTGGEPGVVTLGDLTITGLPAVDAAEFFAERFLIQAVSSAVKDYGLTSIVIIVHNQLAFTMRCVDSIRFRTDEPYELIFIDNASTDGTSEYLKSLPGAKVIINKENRGFPAAANQGILAAQGQNVLLLNNDTVVTTGWLKRMLAALYERPDIGLAGPCSNNISGEQQIRVTYDDLADLDGFAWKWGKQQNSNHVDTDRLVGFCLLIRRDLIDRIGLLDERFGIGCFEDDDYCRRALQAGYRAVVAYDSFVHHFGSQTFRASGVDLGALLRENQRKYIEKWNSNDRSEQHESAGIERPTSAPMLPSGTGAAALAADATMAQPLLKNVVQPQPGRSRRRFSFERAPGGGLRLKTRRLRLSACLIVRDNEDTIRACLASLRPWVDEIVIVDTGSTDRTIEICREYGARVFHFTWCDDFSAARNESIRHARGEWIFWMDSDDTISPECGRMLRELADSQHPEGVLGYVMKVHCPGQADDDGYTVVDQVKLFPNRADLRWEWRLHEQILMAIRRAGGEVLFTDIYVTHSGSVQTPEARRRKLERDFRILALEYKERPHHPFVLFNLGMTHADAGNYAEAIRHLNHCLEVSAPGESQVRKTYALLVTSHSGAGDHRSAWEACRKGLEVYPDDPELSFRAGALQHHFGQLNASERYYRQALESREQTYFASIDPGIRGFKARQNLALVYQDLGELEQAAEQWRLVMAEKPAYRAAWNGLSEVLLRQQRYAALGDLARKLKSNPEYRGGGFLMLARLYDRQGDVNAARYELETGIAELPREVPLHQELCRLLFDFSEPAITETALLRLLHLVPDDASALLNLGMINLRTKKFAAAEDYCRRSLVVRPKYATAMLYLGHALRGQGRRKDAIDVWREILEFDPTHHDALESIRQAEARPQ